MNETKKISGEIKISSIVIKLLRRDIRNLEGLKEKIGSSLDKNVTEILEIILIGAILLGISDIHLEPEEKNAKLRFRMDGILQDIFVFNLKTYKLLASRIKVLSKLKLNVENKPQDGRFSIVMKDLIEIRASALPAENGESFVLRLLNPANLITIEELGLSKHLVEAFNEQIKKPNGMIIVTGPTGSGKTTTLYAVLKKINSPDVKVITIEDPVEYHLPGLSQTQVDPAKGYTFANGLRSLMRQDPDVILVGEIRDLETAEIGMQAALTGHLVFSTLHTNDAAGAVSRLIDLGVKPISIAPSLNMVVAQRLPRKVCKHCFDLEKPSEKDLQFLEQELSNLPIEIPAINSDIKIPKINGCQECNFTGYKGRIGIYETFLVDDEIERFILESPSIVDLKEMAIKKGMILMKKDGLIKVLEGITTIEEIKRVAG